MHFHVHFRAHDAGVRTTACTGVGLRASRKVVLLMRNHVRSVFPLVFSLALLGLSAKATVANELQQCGRIASKCKNAGGSTTECQRKVDDCMSENACEEVYLSCLELMEIEESLTEAACEKKRNECRKKRGG